MLLKLTLGFVGIWLLAAAIRWLPLPHPVPRPESKARVFASAITTGVLLLGWMGVFMLTLVRYASGVCPPASLFFEQAELLGEERWHIFGRHYCGRRAGHLLEIFFFPGQSVRRPLLVMELAARPVARLGAGRKSPLAAGIDGPTLETGYAELAGLIVVSPDAATGRALIDNGEVRAALAAICADPEPNGAREMALLTDRVRVRWHPLKLDVSEVRGVLDRMAALAEKAESAQRPR